MHTTIDGAGRIVVPKALRDSLRLMAGQQLDISVVDGRLIIEILPTAMRLEQTTSGPVAVSDEDLPPLTADSVRAVLEQTRR
jgi:AbrB family looped-hinge helix DNA binding protein